MQVGETGETQAAAHEVAAPGTPPALGDSAAAHATLRARPRRRLRVLRAAALVVVLPLAALGVGLLAAWIVHAIRGTSTPSRPSAPPASAPAASPRASAIPARPRVVVVPADWIAEVAPPAGLTYSHPPGWIRRTSAPEVLRLEPATPGSTAPGIPGVGAGFEAAVDPAQAIRDFGSRVYGGQPGFIAAPVTSVAVSHPGEQQGIVTYLRSGVDVRVVIHSFRSGTRTVLLLGRSANAQPALAGRLESALEASLKVAG
jgi:hypothetical protein